MKAPDPPDKGEFLKNAIPSQIVRVQGAGNPSRLSAMSGDLQRSNRTIWPEWLRWAR